MIGRRTRESFRRGTPVGRSRAHAEEKCDSLGPHVWGAKGQLHMKKLLGTRVFCVNGRPRRQ
jgi:hypothetical protein